VYGGQQGRCPRYERAEIAELQSVPYDYLAKIFTRLSKAGLVRSIEGKGGGFSWRNPLNTSRFWMW
jgi:DNA-binding IscR family transcriptional regulator